MQDLMELSIRYEDLALAKNRMKLDDFAKSLSGYANVLGIVANYALVSQIEEKPDNWQVVISTEAEIKKGSIDIIAIISSVATTAVSLQPIAETLNTFKETVSTLIGFVFSKRESADMERVLEYIEKRDERDLKMAELAKEERENMLATLLEALQKPGKIALQPIGKSCKQINIYAIEQEENPKLVAGADKEIKKVFNKQHTKTEISESLTVNVLFVSIDKLSKKCTFVLESDIPDGLDDIDSAPRIKGNITDPRFELESNLYTKAFDQNCVAEVEAKIKTTGDDQTYFISNIKGLEE